MLTVTSILGNLKRDVKLNQIYIEYGKRNKVENLVIQRAESEKVRMRKLTDKGTDIGFILPSRTHLRDGDVVFLDDNKIIVINLSPELVAIMRLKDPLHGDRERKEERNQIDVAVKIGHTIGNLHRPLKIENGNIIFPIQTPDEVNLFLRLLSDLKDHVIIHSDIMIFEPDKGFDIHAH